MADQRQVTLRQGHATPSTVILRDLPVASVSVLTVYLYAGNATPANPILRDPATRDAPVIPPAPGGTAYLRIMMGLG